MHYRGRESFYFDIPSGTFLAAGKGTGIIEASSNVVMDQTAWSNGRLRALISVPSLRVPCLQLTAISSATESLFDHHGDN